MQRVLLSLSSLNVTHTGQKGFLESRSPQAISIAFSILSSGYQIPEKRLP